MQVRVQDNYVDLFQQALSEAPECEDFFNLNSDIQNADIVIGDHDFLNSTSVKSQRRILLCTQDSIPSTDLLLKGQTERLYVVRQDAVPHLTQVLQSIKRRIEKDKRVALVKREIQKKRKELELLNQQLSSESEKKVISLEKLHSEENEKNQNEKSLLHFLDFIQSESVTDDFVEKVFRFIWKDLKKTLRLHLIGLGMLTHGGKSKILFYDGVAESTSLASIDFTSNKISQQLATVWGRPVAKVLTWQLPEISRPCFLFFETAEKQSNLDKVQTYMVERLAILSIYLDRWMIEKETEVVVDRWQNTFKSFSGYTHVVDENFSIYQANYPYRKGDVCYKVLAGREQPCEECPVLKSRNTQFLLREDLSVKTYISQFRFESKKYHFVIYEDVTKLIQLQSNIIQTEKMSTLGRLGNHLAHELNNPLTGIKSYVQTILSDTPMMETLPATAQSDLSEILKATIRCQKIIKNFIDFSQKKEPTLEKVNFHEVVQNTVVLLKTALRSHRLFIDLKDEIVQANAHDLQQVVFNLIKNSCQAMNATGTLKIYQETVDGKVYFHIEDSGPGFDAAILKNIFQPFMTTKQQGEGTGLGLYLSKKLMNNMNADLQVLSSEKGAKISLVFDKL